VAENREYRRSRSGYHANTLAAAHTENAEYVEPDAEAIRRKAEQAEFTPVYIALFGQPGAGKSSLINAIVGQQVAKVGVENDVTTERTDYECNGLFLSDLPGYGTAKFPAATYREKFEITKFDIFLCVSAGKLKDDDIAFFRELVHAGKRCIFVRNKIDGEFEPGVTDLDIRARIAADFRNQVGGDPRIIFTSCRTLEGLDELITTIRNMLSGVKRDRFQRSAAAYSKEFLDAKRAACQAYALYAAGASAAANMVPVPGLGIAVDISSILTAMAKIRSDFNLTDARMDKFTHLMPGVGQLIKQVVTYATSEGAMLLLQRIGACMARPATGAAAAPTLLQPSRSGSMPGSSIRLFRRPFRGSFSTRSGSIAPRMVSMFAMAIASMMPSAVTTWIAECGRCVIGWCCAGLAKTNTTTRLPARAARQLPDHYLRVESTSTDDSPLRDALP
jgi:small GTP-binding protein